MPANLLRFEKGSAAHWGVVLQGGVAPLLGDYPTTADLIARGETDWREAGRREPSLALESLAILSPVTAPCCVFCQGANYRRHMIESGMDPDAKAFNMFFTKTDASISPAIGAVRRPEHVALLDYEIELALVFRRASRAAVTVTTASLKDYVFAVAIANDLSARDVQLPQTQFFKGKSYRGFCPIGPWLTVLEPDEFGGSAGSAPLGQRRHAPERRHRQSRLQAGRNDHRIVDLRRHRRRRGAVDRNPPADAPCAFRPPQFGGSCSFCRSGSSGSC